MKLRFIILLRYIRVKLVFSIISVSINVEKNEMLYKLPVKIESNIQFSELILNKASITTNFTLNIICIPNSIIMI